MQYTDKDIPTWTLIGDEKCLTFQHEDDESNKWLLRANSGQVLAVLDKDDKDKGKDKEEKCYSMQVYYVKSMSANDIPYIDIGPPSK